MDSTSHSLCAEASRRWTWGTGTVGGGAGPSAALAGQLRPRVGRRAASRDVALQTQRAPKPSGRAGVSSGPRTGQIAWALGRLQSPVVNDWGDLGLSCALFHLGRLHSKETAALRSKRRAVRGADRHPFLFENGQFIERRGPVAGRQSTSGSRGGSHGAPVSALALTQLRISVPFKETCTLPPR